jgi:hypothetical protein
MNIQNIAKEINNEVIKSKAKKNKEHHEVTKIFDVLPTYLLGFLLTVASYLGQNVGINIPPLNV